MMLTKRKGWISFYFLLLACFYEPLVMASDVPKILFGEIRFLQATENQQIFHICHQKQYFLL